MFTANVIFVLGLIARCYSLPAASTERPTPNFDPSNANSLKCLQATERCMAPLDFLREAFVQLKFTNVSPSDVTSFCSSHLDDTTACLQDIVCPIPMPHLQVLARLINWICSTKETFIESRPCFTSKMFKKHAKSCYKPPTRMCRPGNCPTPYTELAECLKPHLLHDEQCSAVDVAYISRYFQNLDFNHSQ